MSPGEIIFLTFLTQMSRFGAIFLHLPLWVTPEKRDTESKDIAVSAIEI